MSHGVKAAESAARPAWSASRLPWWRLAVGVPLGLYVITRLTQLAFVVAMAPADGRSLIDRLMVWDAGWFTRVAEDGYETGYSYDAEGRLTGNGLA
ncbi:MAG: hypothetical protein ACRDT8_06515, partial [Micromonosporaceae bacterium]